jgi:hypothetical protein
MADFLILVNAGHPLPTDWVPDDLVDLWAQQPRHFLLPMRRASPLVRLSRSRRAPKA